MSNWRTLAQLNHKGQQPFSRLRPTSLRLSSLFLTSLVLSSLSPSSGVYGQVPRLVRYQGQAQDANGVPLEGPYSLTCRLYDAETAGAILWQETQASVPLTKGHFSLLLGQVSPLSVDWSKALWLSVQVGSEPELSPRQRITSVPMAIRAEAAEQLVGGGTSARVYNSAHISINNDTVTVLTFDSERFDTATIHSTSSNTGRLTATTAGKYLITGYVAYASNATGVRRAYIRVNGGAYLGVMTALADSSGATELVVSSYYNLAATDYVELMVYQNSGGALNVLTSASESPEFAMVKVN